MNSLTQRTASLLCLCMALALCGLQAVHARTLTVGPGKEFIFPSVAAKFAEDGDVIEIDADALAAIDMYEGYPDLYTRKTVTTLGGHDVVVYVFNQFIRSWRYNERGYPMVSTFKLEGGDGD